MENHPRQLEEAEFLYLPDKCHEVLIDWMLGGSGG
jgi:hypothetical protein